MTALTTTVLRAAGISPAATDITSYPGTFVAEWLFDGNKQAMAAADTADFFDLPALTGVVILGAALTVIRPGTATGVLSVQIAATNITGLTAWATDAAAGTKLVKLATAANTTVNTSSATAIRVLQGTAAIGAGAYRLRVWGTLLEAPPV